MTIKRAALTTLSVVFLSAGLAPAQQLRDAINPAEYPPASFTGNQYVDSRGCVYIRAGISGATTWVPRVTRDRRLVCGFKPSLPNAVAKVEPKTDPQEPAAQGTVAQATKPQATAPQRTSPTAPQASAQSGAVTLPTRPARPAQSQAQVTAPKVAQVTKPNVAQSTSSATQAPQATVANRTAPQVAEVPTGGAVKAGGNGKTVRPVKTNGTLTAAQATAPAPNAAPTKRATRKAAPVKTARAFQRPEVVAPNQTADAKCEEASGFSKLFVNKGDTLAVRCGPQLENPVTVKSTRVVSIPATKSTANPSAVSNAQIQQYAVPKGYVSVWDDDRLNPFRGPRTLQGDQQMRLVWTDEVPRRLVDKVTGADVTALNPNLRYPYTNLAEQQSAQVAAPSNERVSTKSAPQRLKRAVKTKPAKVAPKSKSKSNAAKPYVQVGLFGVPSNADKAAKSLEAKGVPAKVKTIKKGGKTFKIVYSGPYREEAHVREALKRAQALGFKDAFLRR